MKYKTKSLLRAPRLALAMTSLFALPCLAVDPATVLPDESVAYMEMDSQAFYKLEGHPVIKTMPLAKLEELMLKMSKSSPDENERIKKMMTDEMGMTYEELEKKFGRLAMTFHDLNIPANPQPENVGAEFSMAAELDGDEAFMEKYMKVIFKVMTQQLEKQSGQNGAPDLDELLKKAAEVMEHTTAEHGGVKIHIWKLKETDDTKNVPKLVREWSYAIHDKMVLVSSGQDGVEEMLDRMKSGANTGSLAASAFYKKDHEKAGQTLGMASLNLETILGLVEKYALPLADSSEVDVAKVWKALGADKLQSAAIALGAGEDSLDLIALLTYSEKPGLFAVPVIPGSGKVPEFLPASLTSAGYQQMDVEKTLDNAIKLAAQIYPPAEQVVEMGLNAAKAQVGVDIRKDLLSQLGPDFWTASAAGKPAEAKSGGAIGITNALLMGFGGKSVMGIRLKDSKAFGLALDTIINKVASKDALFSTREYQGHTINEVKESPEEFRVAYVQTDEWLILSIGGGEVLEQILGRLGKSGDGGFFAQKVVARHLDALRSGQAATSVSDLGETISSVFGLLEMATKQTGAGALEFPFAELGKLLKLPLWSVDKAWIDGGHLEYRMRIVPKGE